MKEDTKKLLSEEGVPPEKIEALMSGEKTDEILGIYKNKHGNLVAKGLVIGGSVYGTRGIRSANPAAAAVFKGVNFGYAPHHYAILWAREEAFVRIWDILEAAIKMERRYL